MPTGLNRVVFSSRRYRPNLTKFSDKLHENTKTFWDDAIAEFVKATAANVRVGTGMSLGSLIPLGRVVRATVATSRAYGGMSKATRGVTDIDGSYSRGDKRMKNVFQGIHAGARGKSFEILYGGKTRVVLKFTFSIEVFQWLIHDMSGYQNGPWGAVNSGITAMNSYVATNQATVFPDSTYWLDRDEKRTIIKGGF